jgi:hypothetical protein
MAPPSIKSGNGRAINTARQARYYRLWALALMVLGACLLAYQLGLLPDPLAQVAALWPALLILLGLVLVTGRLTLGLALPSFAVDRGDYQSAHLHLAAGVADAQISAFAGASQLAVGQFPGYGGPRLQANAASATLILDRRATSPFFTGPWTVSLVKGLAWSFTLHSDVGHFNLNLRDLTVAALDLRSGVGDVELTLPAAGQGEMTLRLGLGDLTVRIPNGMAVKIKLEAGPLTGVRLDDHRFIQTNPSEWVTPNFSASLQRFTLCVSLTTGDLHVV